ncbi:MAG: HDIG domain-containing protein [Bacteroidaceae bacterium]|nr:HDIG domain-containing protein [Bacteroidaceae bacterium]MBR6856535.1 HDIG domain-containing protein [Bacteroidaceae bacterium]
MNDKRRFLKSNRSLLVILSVVSALLTVYFMPAHRQEKYTFTVGKPWTYDVLIAPFNFSIQKSDEVWQAEADSVKASFAPYFSRNASVSETALAEFDRFYKDSLSKVVWEESYQALRRRLEKVYRDGIISTSDEEVLSGKRLFRVYEGNTSSFVQTSSVRSVRDAYRLVTDAEMYVYDRYTLLQHNLEQYIQPNLVYDESRSEADLTSQLNEISHYRGMVVEGQKIIDQGEIVDEQKSNIINSYLNIVNEKNQSKRFEMLTWAGRGLFVLLCFLVLFIYLSLYRIDDIENRSILWFLFGSISLFTVSMGLYCQYSSWSIFLFPCSMLAIMLRIFLDSRTAFTGYMAFVLSTSLIVSMPYEYVLLQFLAGLTGIYSLKELSQRSQILRTCLLIFISYSLVWTAFQMTQLENIRDIDPLIFLYFAINCIVILLVYPLLFVIEKLFGFTSNVTLIELSNINNPLLRELAEKAPGTFQHSMQVSTLASEAATRIKASPQLVRTAALYHDIGKMDNAPFFTENQNGVNPHDKLTPQESARIITGHVEKGLELADKYGLPESIRGFIASHHGKGVARYFYIKYSQDHPDQVPDPHDFSYPGPNPYSKETAVVMMADAVEAASRSLKEYTEESIGELVDKIIDTQVQEGYFQDCPISWQDIKRVKETFKEKLRTMYHTRISYPEATVGPDQKKQ